MPVSVNNCEVGFGYAKVLRERIQIRLGSRIVASIHNGDGSPPAGRDFCAGRDGAPFWSLRPIGTRTPTSPAFRCPEEVRP